LISWRLARFDELSAREAHDIFQARIEVFVVEQKCVFQDLDGLDPECWHLLGIARDALGPHRPGDDEPLRSPAGSRLVAYCRLVPPGTRFAEPSIGRVLTTESARGAGAGRELMRRAVDHATRLWPGKALRIGAQKYLEHFYGEFGFVTASEPYDEDGIPHVEMLRAAYVAPDASVPSIGQ
jgi:ElaA protein